MTAPTVNMNGTIRTELLEDLKVAHVAVAVALEAVRKCAPHGRDYPDAAEFVFARNDHFARLTDLGKMKCDLENLAQAVALQPDRRCD